MEYRKLPHIDLNVSRLCFGTMTFGKPADQSAATRMVDISIAAGINFFDTANAYQGGRSEEMLGQALQGRRNQCVVATKGFARMGEAPDDAGLSKSAIFKAVDASLKRLRTDYVDLYYLHQPDYKVPIDESLEALDTLVEAGKIRYPATSNYSSWQVTEMLWEAEKHRWAPPVVSQSMYNLLARGLDQEFLPMAKRFGVAVIAYNPLAGGLLTGKHNPEHVAQGTRFDGNKMYQDRYWRAEDFEAIAELKSAAEQSRRSLVSLALCWMLHHTPIDSIILGASREEQLVENLRAAGEGPLSPDALAACDRVWAGLRGPSPIYNR
jgi:1-deoxyxylulose-5-phosphate synthase